MEKKKVLVEFITTLSNGGAESLIREYALRLKDSPKVELKIVLIWDFEGSVNSKILKENNISYDVIYPSFGGKNALFHKFFGKKHIGNYLKKYCEKNHVDVVHSHLETIKYLDPVVKHCKDVKILYTIHSDPATYFEEKNDRIPYIKKYSELNRITLVCIDKGMEQIINSKYHYTNTVTINNGIDTSRFLEKFDKKEVRKSIGVPEKAFVIGNVGRFTYAKNHPFIIKVFEEVLKIKDNAHLLLVGDGELKEETMDLINSKGLSDKVSILSKRTDVNRLYQAMDIFLFPSNFEGLPLSVLEAQLSGLNCVVSERITPQVFVYNQVTVLKLSDDVSKWVDALLNFKSNAKPLNKAEDYDIKNVIDKLIEVIYSI